MKLIRYALFIGIICWSAISEAQDTASLSKLIKYAGTLDPDKTDSVLFYATYIKAASLRLDYPYGIAASSRLRGRYYQYKENFDSAIIEFHEYERLAGKYNSGRQQLNAISDIAGVYMLTEQYELAKQNYFTFLELATKTGTSPQNISQTNNNIAGAYQYLGNNDSALFYYNIALQIDENLKDSVRLAERKSNISEVLIPMGQIDLARKYLLESTAYNERYGMNDALWYNYNNLGNVYMILKDYKRSAHYYELSYEQAQKTSTKTKMVETLNGFSKLYQKVGDYRQALEYKIKADSIGSISLNENTNKKIAELQEKYQSKKKEQQNIELAAQLEKEGLQKRNLAITALSLLLIAVVVAAALYINTKRKNLLKQQNKLINEQKDKLSELNLEKNSLISIVSHDLNAPIVNIQLWAKLLRAKLDPADAAQTKALRFIQESADYGYDLIQNILGVERVETGHHKLQLEEIELIQCVTEIANQFTVTAERKKIQLHAQVDPASSTLLSDKTLLKRIIENLVSNSLKFSQPHTNVSINAQQQSGITTIIVKDEGPGISEEDQQKLFGKYVRLDNAPTANEPTTGLGLHIVKRIVTELNGKIEVQSTVGKGSEFKVIFGTDL